MQHLIFFIRLAVFHGVLEYTPLRAGVRTCSLIACFSNDTTTCGRSPDSIPLTFKSISITGTFKIDEYIFDQPDTLQTNLQPVDNYLYCAETQDSENVKITISTSVEQKSILSFGIYGRMNNVDGWPVQLYSVAEVSGGISINRVIIPLVSVVLLLVALFIGLVLYRKSKKYNVIER